MDKKNGFSNSLERIAYLDYMKAIGIILVIAGHTNFSNSFIKGWIYSFHMPLFFFLSGFTYKTVLDTSDLINTLIVFFKKKFFALLIPYFLWAMIYAELSLVNITRICYGSYLTLSKAGSLTSLWFLPTLFLASCFFEIGMIIKRSIQFKISSINYFLFSMFLMIMAFYFSFLFPELTFGYPFGFNVAFCGWAFMLLGNTLAPLVKKLEILTVIQKKILILFVALLSMIISMFYRFNFSDQNYILMANARYGNFLLFLISSIGGCFFILSFALILDSTRGSIRILSYIGENTLCLFAIHKPIISALSKILKYSALNEVIILSVSVILTFFYVYRLHGL